MAETECLTCCIVCGFDLGFKPWNEDSPSDEICPCCGIQYGYDDADNADLQRQQVYEQWRLRWVKGGMTWWSKSRLPPAGWNPALQLRRLATEGD
jgi:hypothetical protein